MHKLGIIHIALVGTRRQTNYLGRGNDEGLCSENQFTPSQSFQDLLISRIKSVTRKRVDGIDALGGQLHLT